MRKSRFTMETRYKDRRDAGRQLAARLGAYAQRPDLLVLGLPRGGVPVAFEVARALQAPLDVCLARSLKVSVEPLGIPGVRELTIGALAAGGVQVLNMEAVRLLHIDMETIEALVAQEQAELDRCEQFYSGQRPRPDVRGRALLLVDDGMNTGAVMRATALALRSQQPARLAVAVPIASPASCESLRDVADEVICPFTPAYLFAIGFWYEDFFTQISDDEVLALLKASEH